LSDRRQRSLRTFPGLKLAAAIGAASSVNVTSHSLPSRRKKDPGLSSAQEYRMLSLRAEYSFTCRSRRWPNQHHKQYAPLITVLYVISSSWSLCSCMLDFLSNATQVTGLCSKGTSISSPGSQFGPAKPLRLLSGSSLSAIVTVTLVCLLAVPPKGLRSRQSTRGAAPPSRPRSTAEWTHG
jgi:hypothetical protein